MKDGWLNICSLLVSLIHKARRNISQQHFPLHVVKQTSKAATTIQKIARGR